MYVFLTYSSPPPRVCVHFLILKKATQALNGPALLFCVEMLLPVIVMYVLNLFCMFFLFWSKYGYLYCIFYWFIIFSQISIGIFSFYLPYTCLTEPVLLDETCLTHKGALVSHASFEFFLQYIILSYGYPGGRKRSFLSAKPLAMKIQTKRTPTSKKLWSQRRSRQSENVDQTKQQVWSA